MKPAATHTETSPAPAKRYDVVVIGGGPAGSTAATLLARQGLSVVVVEKKRFPRFHIGESLLPASVPIFEELGVNEKLKSRFIRKPGGYWLYGDRPTMSDFAAGPDTSSFADTPYSYMVRRAEFDDLLLKNAEEKGATVLEGYSVSDLIREGESVRGVSVRDELGKTSEVRCDWVFDCSGYSAVVATKLKLRRENRLKRMAIFGHFETKAVHEKLKQGWFVGEMIPNGWVWLIPQTEELISIGVVLPFERYQATARSAEQFLHDKIREVPLLRTGVTPEPRQHGKVHVYGNLGYTTSRAHGDGWVSVGDAAFFIDPCYSSGVHMALSSAKAAATAYLEHRRGTSAAAAFAAYERELRHDEKVILQFVDAFYMASRNRFLKWLVPRIITPSVNRRFVSITGGDFTRGTGNIALLYYFSWIVSRLFPFPVRETAAAGGDSPAPTAGMPAASMSPTR